MHFILVLSITMVTLILVNLYNYLLFVIKILIQLMTLKKNMTIRSFTIIGLISYYVLATQPTFFHQLNCSCYISIKKNKGRFFQNYISPLLFLINHHFFSPAQFKTHIFARKTKKISALQLHNYAICLEFVWSGARWLRLQRAGGVDGQPAAGVHPGVCHQPRQPTKQLHSEAHVGLQTLGKGEYFQVYHSTSPSHDHSEVNTKLPSKNWIFFTSFVVFFCLPVWA